MVSILENYVGRDKIVPSIIGAGDEAYYKINCAQNSPFLDFFSFWKNFKKKF